MDHKGKCPTERTTTDPFILPPTTFIAFSRALLCSTSLDCRQYNVELFLVLNVIIFREKFGLT